MRAVDYAQAAGTGATDAPAAGISKEGADLTVQAGSVKTEKINNLYGSVAGASSSDFHVYRAARARENKRLEAMDEEVRGRGGGEKGDGGGGDERGGDEREGNERDVYERDVNKRGDKERGWFERDVNERGNNDRGVV